MYKPQTHYPCNPLSTTRYHLLNFPESDTCLRSESEPWWNGSNGHPLLLLSKRFQSLKRDACHLSRLMGLPSSLVWAGMPLSLYCEAQRTDNSWFIYKQWESDDSIWSTFHLPARVCSKIRRTGCLSAQSRTLLWFRSRDRNCGGMAMPSQNRHVGGTWKTTVNFCSPIHSEPI